MTVGRPPKFDHSKPCAQHVKGDYRWLEQNGRMWTSATYDRLKKRYVPEPKPLSLDDIPTPVVKTELTQVIEHLEAIVKLLKPLAPTLELIGARQPKGVKDG